MNEKSMWITPFKGENEKNNMWWGKLTARAGIKGCKTK